MVKLFEHEGVPLNAVSVANEPQFTQTFESCLWTADDWAAANAAVGRALDAAGYGEVKLFGPETMTGFNWPGANPSYLKAIKDDPYLQKRLGVYATHGYSDGFNADNSAKSSWDFWNLVKGDGRPYWVTEGGTGGHDWPAPVDGVAMCLHNALVAGNASAVVPWQITENKLTDGTLMLMRHADGQDARGAAVFSLRPAGGGAGGGDAGATRRAGFMRRRSSMRRMARSPWCWSTRAARGGR